VLVRLADSWTESAEMEILMTSLRKFGYAVLLAASILNYAPNLAVAEEPARGRFTLTHNVSWENTSVSAGDYEFAYDPNGVSPVLTITKVSGSRASFMLMVPGHEESKRIDSNRILLETSAEGSYVSALQLPEAGVTLRFDPPRASVKQMAKAVAAGGASGQ
jgi:hypothetical protein